MKNQYILGLIAGASLMLALIVLTAADDDDFKYQILTIEIGDNDVPAFLFNKETGEVHKTNTWSRKDGEQVKWIQHIAPPSN
tara:strand:- start:75 stop:320 length:246 start_codon:yes stop_codon:yes gene_type:complete